MRFRIEQNNCGIPEYLSGPDKPPLQGREADIWRSTDSRYALKVYHTDTGRSDREQIMRLRKVIRLGAELDSEQRQVLAWPIAVINENEGRACSGCVSEWKEGLPIGDLIMNGFVAQKQFRQGRSWGDYLRLARRLAEAIAMVNDMGCVHCDIHHDNFICDLQRGRLSVIDLDSLAVGDWLSPRVGGILEFMAPEIVTRRAKPSRYTDRHSLAVLVLYTLLFRNPLRTRILDEDPEEDALLMYGEQAVFAERAPEQRRLPWVGRPFNELRQQSPLTWFLCK